MTSFYIGGSMGAFLPGLAWNAGGWTACIAMVVAMLATMALDRGPRLSRRHGLVSWRFAKLQGGNE